MDWMLSVALLLGSTSPDEAFERVGGGPAPDRGIHVSPLRDGGYVAVGVTRSFGEGGDDVYVVRTDSRGTREWTKTFGGPDTDNGWSVHETADGLITGGFTRSFGAGGFDFYLVKTDPKGEEQWSKTYGGPKDDRCWAVLSTRDGGFLLAGETKSQGAGEEDFFVVKVDAEGVEQWSKAYGGARGDRCFAVAQADDGGYVLAGQTYSDSAGERDAHIVKIGANGDLEWSRTFGGEARDVGHGITQTSDGHFLVTGYTASFEATAYDPYLIKIDAQGELLWTRVIPMDGVNRTLTGEQASGGGYYLVGVTENPATRRTAALVVRTDDEGRLRWSEDVMPTIGGDSFGYTVRATRDGGCILTGHTTVDSAGGRDLFLVKLEDRQ